MNTTWQNYSSFAEARGTLVAHILQQYGTLTGKKILDVGCGDGGTAAVLSQKGAHVHAIDIRHSFRFNNNSIHFNIMSAHNLAFENGIFDIVVLQDVLEHLPHLHRVLSEINRVLKKHGKFFLTTPNRLSLLNFASDPHWNLPFISILPRRGVKLMVQKIVRRDKRPREDWAALLTLARLRKLLLSHNFQVEFHNSVAARQLFENPTSIVCNPVHLKIVSFLSKRNFQNIVYRIVNDNFGVFNHFLNPTWYIVGNKKQSI